MTDQLEESHTSYCRYCGSSIDACYGGCDGARKARVALDSKKVEAEAPQPEVPQKRRYGNTLGLTKETNPKLSNRLPREKGAIVAPAGDGLSPFERAKKLLKDRVQEKPQFYTLDGRPTNTMALLDAGTETARKVLSEPISGRPGDIMAKALEFLWAQRILAPRVKKEADGWMLDDKIVNVSKIVSTAHKLVSDLRKAARSTKKIEGVE